MAKAILAGASAEAALFKAAAAYHQKRVALSGVKKTTAQEAAEFYGIDIPEGISLEMPQWLKTRATFAIAESFQGEWWNGMGFTTKFDLQQEIVKAIELGLSIRDVADSIMAKFGGEQYPRYRANNIARTELGNAMNAGHSAGIAQLEQETGLPMGKEWVSVMGPTTRITHADTDGQQTDSADGMFNLAGYECRWPADDSLPPEERCNCMCTIISSFSMSAVDEGDGQPDIEGLDEDTEAELPEADSYQIPQTQDDIPEEEPTDPKISAALDRLEALSYDVESGGVAMPFKTVVELPYTPEEVNEFRRAMIDEGLNPRVDLPSEKIKLSALHVQEDAKADKVAVSALIQDPAAIDRRDTVGKYGMPADLPLVIQKNGKLYVEDGGETLTALKLQKKTKAEVYLVNLDKATATGVAESKLPDFATLKDTGKTLGGSTGAKLMQDEGGRLFVVKTGSSADHLREEYRAENAYRAAGVPIPASKLEDVGGVPHKISEFINGQQLSDLSVSEQKAIFKQLQKGFGTDALLANWDTVGLSLDNVIVAKDGTAYRIDVGGALRFRAQGGAKGAAFANNPLELWTLRDGNRNASSAKVFGDMTNKEITDSAKAALKNRRAVLDAVKDSPELRDKLEQRFIKLERFVKQSDEFRADAWADKHIDRVTYHDQHADAAGVFDRMAKKMEAERTKGPYGDYKVIVRDENGKDWDHLRGDDSAQSRFAKYVDGKGLKHAAIRDYCESQAGSSWSERAMAMKHYVTTNRETSGAKYYFQEPPKACAEQFKNLAVRHNLTEEQLHDTLAANQAFYYRFCKQVEFPNNEREAGVLLLARTESDKVMRRYGAMATGEFHENIVRGSAESFSLHTGVSVHGHQLTLQAVPHTRIFAHYYHERTGGRADSLLYGDTENEVVADAQGVKVYHVGYISGKDAKLDMKPLAAEVKRLAKENKKDD